ncbi:MAG: hypothetical protein M0Q14_01765 [Tissierellaceae bacterium]|nr:hypothetical protein [Tissierellaceae bacterium]
MDKFTYKNGRVQINIKTIELGNDLCVAIWGGEKPHIGTITLSVARPSLADESRSSSTTSTINITGHKDDEVAKPVSEMLSAKLNKNVAVTCGIHIVNITLEEIKEIISVTINWAERYIENSIL